MRVVGVLGRLFHASDLVLLHHIGTYSKAHCRGFFRLSTIASNNMTNSNQPAFATGLSASDSSNRYLQPGLTKLEYLSGLAMQGLASACTEDGTWSHDPKTVAVAAVDYAKALLAELEKETNQTPQP